MNHLCRAPRTLRSTLIVLLVFILIGSACNFPIAFAFLKSPSERNLVPTVLDVEGERAGDFSWPTATPHDFEWPMIERWLAYEDFGYRRIQARAYEPFDGVVHRGGQTMAFELMGWPLPVLERVQMWWPSDDPKWETTSEPDPALRIHWAGTVGNPLLFAVPMWFLLVFRADAWRWFIRRRRMKKGRCPACAYDLRATEGQHCPECGSFIVVPER